MPQAPAPRRPLITNDDGIASPGLALLARVAREVFGGGLVVAPDRERSATSHALSLHRPLRCHETPGPLAPAWAIDGTPVDCVLVGLGHLSGVSAGPDGAPVDLVLSGVNRGPNLGFDCYYSGTVAAAREGQIKGRAGVALSLAGKTEDAFDFDAVEPAVRALLTAMARGAGPGPGELWNINLPAAAPRDDGGLSGGGWAGVPGFRGVQITRLGRRTYRDAVLVREDPRGKPYAWIGGPLDFTEMTPGTDGRAVHDGFVSVTPLQLDNTAPDRDRLDAWRERLPPDVSPAPEG